MTATVVAAASAFPEYILESEDVRHLYERAFGGRVKDLDTYTAMVDHAGIETRHLVRPGEETIARKPLDDKNRIFTEESQRLGERAAAECLDRAGVAASDVHCLMTLSCTGFMIPPLDAYLVNRMGFRPDVVRIPVTEMGCAAGAWSLGRCRDRALAHPGGLTLVVSVELPSLTFQPDDLSPANLVSSVLFGDGSAAILVRGDSSEPGLEICNSRSIMFPGTTDVMGFDLHSTGFHIILDRKIPVIIARRARPELERFLEDHSLSPDQIGFWAIHPGGKKILDSIASALSLGAAELERTLAVWSRRGNLSSATVLAILEQHLLHRPRQESPGIAVAFGPGFCMEMVLLRSH